jgi:hypothetical protein
MAQAPPLGARRAAPTGDPIYTRAREDGAPATAPAQTAQAGTSGAADDGSPDDDDDDAKGLAVPGALEGTGSTGDSSGPRARTTRATTATAATVTRGPRSPRTPRATAQGARKARPPPQASAPGEVRSVGAVERARSGADQGGERDGAAGPRAGKKVGEQRHWTLGGCRRRASGGVY